VESWADSPSKWNGSSVPNQPVADQPVAEPRPTQVVQNKPPTIVQAKPKPKPTQVVKSKPKPKPTPSVRYHTARKGDTLYGLSKRYGTTVGKIQSANGIKGSVIRLGQRLKIPF
jgi:LysM repeat protein